MLLEDPSKIGEGEDTVVYEMRPLKEKYREREREQSDLSAGEAANRDDHFYDFCCPNFVCRYQTLLYWNKGYLQGSTKKSIKGYMNISFKYSIVFIKFYRGLKINQSRVKGEWKWARGRNKATDEVRALVRHHLSAYVLTLIGVVNILLIIFFLYVYKYFSFHLFWVWFCFNRMYVICFCHIWLLQQ